jgi:hypothetical protein
LTFAAKSSFLEAAFEEVTQNNINAATAAAKNQVFLIRMTSPFL